MVPAMLKTGFACQAHSRGRRPRPALLQQQTNKQAQVPASSPNKRPQQPEITRQAPGPTSDVIGAVPPDPKFAFKPGDMQGRRPSQPAVGWREDTLARVYFPIRLPKGLPPSRRYAVTYLRFRPHRLRHATCHGVGVVRLRIRHKRKQSCPCLVPFSWPDLPSHRTSCQTHPSGRLSHDAHAMFPAISSSATQYGACRAILVPGRGTAPSSTSGANPLRQFGWLRGRQFVGVWHPS
ncbi:hypothetical protein LX32DRAFT_646751 [Colletotrichum zoysiae]|uniref:Uncharacterized protein n=1 Tax=Colletotrichum zoysiae TaxID=1216348 RepID=A0AAD9H2C5_9PEZI|nr:hypothetical protein LX32DRAFT_646751 [Colletotrichum zoysiae]